MRQFKALTLSETSEARLFEIIDGEMTVPVEMPPSLEKASGYPMAGSLAKGVEAQAPINLAVERRVFCLGLNYRDHAAEVALEDVEPVVFTKFASTLTAPGGEVTFPRLADELDYEAEVALLVGHEGREIEAGNGERHIAAYFLANDLTSRTLQFESGGQWTLGKNLDQTTPVGPVLGVLEDGEMISGRQIRCFVNDEERQNSNTSQMILSPGSIVEYL